MNHGRYGRELLIGRRGRSREIRFLIQCSLRQSPGYSQASAAESPVGQRERYFRLEGKIEGQMKLRRQRGDRRPGTGQIEKGVYIRILPESGQIVGGGEIHQAQHRYPV
jgi:hypothetical protein